MPTEEGPTLSGPDKTPAYLVRQQIQEFALEAMKTIPRKAADIDGYLFDARKVVEGRLDAWCAEHRIDAEGRAYLKANFGEGYRDAGVKYRAVAQTGDWHKPTRQTYTDLPASSPGMQSPAEKARLAEKAAKAQKAKDDAEAAEKAMQRGTSLRIPGRGPAYH